MAMKNSTLAMPRVPEPMPVKPKMPAIHKTMKSLQLKAGTAVDATFNAAPCATKNKDRAHNPEMRLTL